MSKSPGARRSLIVWTTCVGMRLRRGLIAMRQHALLLPSVVTIIHTAGA